jgi:predicted dehydrogenase
MMGTHVNRRDFLKAGTVLTTGSFLVGGTRVHLLAADPGEPARPHSANDQLQFALIGAGQQGQYDTGVAVRVPGVKLVAAADCYDGRLTHCKEVWGKDLFTTRDYQEILTRKDIDAVIIAVPDHWHKQAALDALNAGKDVYLEKPMIHVYSDGPEIIDTARKTQRILQVGSQRVSSLIYKKAQQFYQVGAIGELNSVTAWWDRNYAVGAFEASIPPDASPETIDWTRFLGTAPEIPFNPEHFFQWRKWRAYGSGVAGDLFVHLFSGTHFITGTHGPTRAMATGGLRFWKDGRDFPDVLMALFDFPQGFNLYLRVNFVSGGPQADSEGFMFTGNEGTMQIGASGAALLSDSNRDAVTISGMRHRPDPGYEIASWAVATQKQFLEEYKRKYHLPQPPGPPPRKESFVAPKNYNDSYDHLKNFFEAVRTRQPVVEDPVFGFRAAGAALLSNQSYEQNGPVRWDPEEMKLL